LGVCAGNQPELHHRKKTGFENVSAPAAGHGDDPPGMNLPQDGSLKKVAGIHGAKTLPVCISSVAMATWGGSVDDSISLPNSFLPVIPPVPGC
jgi:hypothetical protein